MVTWKEFAVAEPDLAEVGRSRLFQFEVGLAFLATARKDGAPRRYALQAFPQPKPGSDEFYIAGKAVLVDDQAARADILRDAKHMADASETAFKLWIDRVMYTRWEHVLTPQMRSEHRKWRAPAGPSS